jgi:hypothetical protein
MMGRLNQVINGLFDLLMRPFMLQSAWPGLIAASLVASIVLVVLFHFSSNPNEIRRTRNRLLARTLELLMFQHDMRTSFTACGRILVANAAYLFQFLRPMAVGLIPLLLMFVQMESWFDRRPLRIGEQAVLSVEIDPTESVLEQTIDLQLTEMLKIDSPSVRVPSKNELAWRIAATGPGDGWIEVISGGIKERKSLSTGDQLARLSQTRESHGMLQQLFSPSEPPLDGRSSIRRMQVSYPRRELLIGQTEIPWLVAAFGLIMIMSLILGRLFGIRIA